VIKEKRMRKPEMKQRIKPSIGPRIRRDSLRFSATFILCLFSESYECYALAGLLTCSPVFAGLPIPQDSDTRGQKGKNELTAAGTVQDLHLIPF
jgi:hypothetical protein